MYYSKDTAWLECNRCKAEHDDKNYFQWENGQWICNKCYESWQCYACGQFKTIDDDAHEIGNMLVCDKCNKDFYENS